MKAKDLMIGDWVCCTDPTPFKIEAITIIDFPEYVTGNDGFDVEIADLQPIPLTTEILEKNGFKELMNESEVSAARFGRKPEPTGVWQYGFGQFDSVAYVPEQSFLRIKFMEGCQADIANIKYVHELQHALRLCGIEKEINL